MNILIDMNLSPVWVSVLNQAGYPTVHWKSIGSPSAPDTDILVWAREHDHVLFTHDLDFGAILAATGTDAPSVIQIRVEDPVPGHWSRVVLDTLLFYAAALASGSLISIDVNRVRVRVLPLKEKRN